MNYVFDPGPRVAVPVAGSDALFPVRRIYCVGRNYAAHAREMGRLYHAKGVERLVRNDLWKGRSPERFYDALEWLWDWRVERCLASAAA